MNKDNNIIPKKYKMHFIMLVSCFILWGLLNNMTDNLVPAFSKIFMLEATNASFIQVAFYGAYAVLALPAAIIIKKYSYRKGVLLGLTLYILGAIGYIPAAIMQNFQIFIVAVFVLASGLSILETSCNPYVISLGSEETSVRRLNMAQAFNPVGSLTGIIMAKFLILNNLNPATYEERVAMTPEQLSEIRSNELLWVCIPYVSLIIIAFIIWVFFKKSNDIENKDNTQLNILASLKKLVCKPRYILGVVAQFFYVGVQIAVWTWTISYIVINKGVDEATASTYYLISIVLFIICRWICTFIMKYIQPAVIMMFFAISGIVFSLGTMYLPIEQSIWCLVLISASMSLMFPTIYGIALKDLGDEVKVGAAGLIMAILGGAVITPIMGKLIDTGAFSSIVRNFSGDVAAIRSSFIIPIICFTVVLIYSIMFCNKKSN